MIEFQIIAHAQNLKRIVRQSKFIIFAIKKLLNTLMKKK